MDISKLKSLVRRLTPVECARLQGFPDDYLDIGDGKGGSTHDSPLYKALGNSWGTNCARWVNSRIERFLRESKMVDDRTIRYATTCSGIEAHSVSVNDLDWQPQFYSEIEPFPCRVLATRYPNIPNLGDMTKVDGNPYDLDVFSGGTPCFTAGNMVLTETGYRPIEKIRVGDKVMSHKGRLCTVSAIGSKMADNIVDVKCKSAPWIRCTDDHKFWTPVHPHVDYRRKSNNYLRYLFEGMEFKDIKSIGVDGFVSRMREYEQIEYACVPKIYNADRLDCIELAGWYVGDGHIEGVTRKDRKMKLILSVNDKKRDAFSRRFGGIVNFSAHLHDKNGVWRVEVCNTEFCNWLLEQFGHLSHNKRIPAWLIASDDSTKDAFIRGYMSTDGFTNEDFVFACSTTSFSLALGISDLVGKCSMYESKVPDKKVMYDGRVVNQRKSWNVRRFATHKCFHEYDKWDILRVAKIERNAPEMVYNITVENDHGYVVNGVCVSNCQSFSVAGKRHGLGGATSWDDTVTRSSLAFHWVRIGLESKARILVWENVPGVYSSSGGKDFPWLLHFLNNHGYSVAWRTLDVQWIATDKSPFAIPQRRRRCWLVAFKGNDWRIPARILWERTDRLGKFAPYRIVNGQKITKGAEPSVMEFVQPDLFGFCEPTGPVFDHNSRADWIPWSEFPGTAATPELTALPVARKCGTVGYAGGIFEGGEVDPEHISQKLRKNIGNAGMCIGDYIITMKMPEWSSGIQLPGGVGCPSEYDGSVNGLSDILHPMQTEDDFAALLKYLLSAKACGGILRRASARGKELPKPLENALNVQIAGWANGLFGDCVKADAETREEEDSGEYFESNGEGDEE